MIIRPLGTISPSGKIVHLAKQRLHLLLLSGRWWNHTFVIHVPQPFQGWGTGSTSLASSISAFSWSFLTVFANDFWALRSLSCFFFLWTCCTKSHAAFSCLLQWQIQGGAAGVCPPQVQILSFWHINFSKCSCLGSWHPPMRSAPPLWEILDPLLFWHALSHLPQIQFLLSPLHPVVPRY